VPIRIGTFLLTAPVVAGWPMSVHVSICANSAYVYLSANHGHQGKDSVPTILLPSAPPYIIKLINTLMYMKPGQGQ
jgi:hypothetical protein